MIDYKDFIIPEFYWDYFVKEKKSLFINSYFRKNNILPSEDMIKNFVIEKQEMEDFKKMLYSKYCVSGIMPESPDVPVLPDVPNEDINPEDIMETIIVYNDGTPNLNAYWDIILVGIKVDFFYSKAKNKRLLIIEQDESFVNMSEVIYNETLKERVLKNFDKSSNDNMWITILGEIKEYIPSLKYSFYYFGGDIDNINEIKEGLEYNNIKLNYIIFDANHGVQIAICDILKNHVRYIIGIPHEAPGTAFTNYMDLFKDNEDIINLKDFCNINFTRQKDSNTPLSLSIIDCNKIEDFLIYFEDLFKDEEQKDIDFSQIQNFNQKYPVYDIINYIEHVFDNEDKILNLKEKIKNVVIEIYKADKYYSLYESYNGYYSISNFCGLTSNFDKENINFHFNTNLHEKEWIELPLIDYSDKNFVYNYHSFDYEGFYKRNYSYCYDIKNHIPKWVAYPIGFGYDIKNCNRTDAWAYDPLIPHNYQANIVNSFRGSYVREMLIPSASRLISEEANRQVFYATNIVPIHYDLNSSLDANIQGILRSKCGDWEEGFLVKGCIYNDNSLKIQDRNNNNVTVPDYFYQMMIHHSLNQDNYIIYCLMYENKNISKEDIRYLTINELEEITGLCYFPNLEKEIGTEKYNELKNLISEKIF